ncbi:hypothetical protein FB567DRAFT_56581 [Paraphoma chrysanthemicola]|uniref:Uncharacterized protein n=1 Tax=Paraphoma chrysanthemicola TaxID=798071 RepID=A0A8K0R3S1_9PLEO|nr:hypothetical protein FB567DRAFT_56581 [Paraphoma chrysanthemicola]
MPAPTACPILEVDRALSSYVHAREETLKIRRALSKYLTASLRPVSAETQNQHLNHECPPNISAVSTNPPGLKGSRLDYLHALRARNNAQSRHKELQASIEDLQQAHIAEHPAQAQPAYDNGSTQSYVSLLRQRRRQAELQVIQHSLERLLTTRQPLGLEDPRTLVEKTIGNQPDLPAERLEQLSQTQDDQTYIFKLKQEVLDARSNLDRANAARKDAQTKAPSSPTLQQQVFALECARDEIVEWVQNELAKLEEESVFLEDASPIKRPTHEATPADLSSIEERIRCAYDKYTTARASLLQHYEMLQHSPVGPASDGNDASGTSEESTQYSTQQPKPVTTLLSHFPHLTHVANTERSLLQQSVYLQSQIEAADQDIDEMLLRLSGESHLLPAGSKDVTAWAKTANEAEVATSAAAKEHILASRQEISSVSAIVELCSLQSKVLATS